MEEFNIQEPEIRADIDWEEELEDHEYEVGNDPFLMSNEEAEQFLVQAGIRFTEEIDEIRFRDHGELDELESNTVSTASTEDEEEIIWDHGYPGEEEDEEEYHDSAPSTRAYALKYWRYYQAPRVSDAECSSGSESDSEETSQNNYPRVSVISRVRTPSSTGSYQIQQLRKILVACMMFMMLGFIAHPVSTSTTHENVIFESIGEMAGATSYLHVQVTISLSSITQQFELYKSKLQSRFTDPHRGAAIINQQFAKNLNMSVNNYLESRQEDDEKKRKFQPVKVIPAPHMNTAVIWSRIAQLHYEDLYEIGLHLTALKNLLPRVPMDNRDRVVAVS